MTINEARDDATPSTNEQDALSGVEKDRARSDLNTLAHRAHNLSRAKGWYDGADEPTPERVTIKLALVLTEVAEAIEEVRDLGESSWGFASVASDAGKPVGLAIELADVLIRVFDLAGWLGLDLDAAVSTKHKYNATRPHRHGGKAL